MTISSTVQSAIEAFMIAAEAIAPWDLSVSVDADVIGTLFDRKPGNPMSLAFEYIAEAYGVDIAFLTSGGTSGLNPLALASQVQDGAKVIVGRDAHGSVLAGLRLVGATPAYIVPRYDATTGLTLPVTGEQVRASLRAHNDAAAVVITAPNYFGIMPNDLDLMVEACDERGVALIVDSAHGAHLGLDSRLPPGAYSYRPTIALTSLHKSAGAMSGCGMLQIPDRSTADAVYHGINELGIVSTSFNTIIVLSGIATVYQLAERWPRDHVGIALKAAGCLRERIDAIPGYRSIRETDLPPGFTMDPLRITVDLTNSSLTGYEVAKRQQSEGLWPEMSTVRNVLYLVSLFGAESRLERTVEIMEATAPPERTGDESLELIAHTPAIPPMALIPRRAFFAKREGKGKRIRLADSVGCISLETIGAYPPGSAVIVAGEEFTSNAVQYLLAVKKAGASIKGASDPDLSSVEVIK